MKMEPRDVMGSLYSEGGLRFGGFRTTDFLNATEPLEEKSPGIREKIVAEAHYLVCWLREFPAIGFFFGIILYKSLWIALLLFVGAFVLEIIRVYIFGSSLFLSQTCRAWKWIKIPVFIIAAISLWPEGNFLPTTLMAFLVFHWMIWFVVGMVTLPIRVIVGRIVYKEYEGHWNNMEGTVMNFVINRWRLKLFPTDKFSLNDKSE